MSLSKNLLQCRIGVATVSRQRLRLVHTESASEKATPDVQTSPSAIMSHFRSMTASQWKLLSQLKEYIAKTSNGNAAMLVLNKEWTALLQKIPSIYGNVEGVQRRNLNDPISHKNQPPSTVKSIATTVSETDQSQIEKIKETATNNQSKEVDGPTYSLPQVFNDLKLRMQPKPKEVVEEITPHWKLKKETVSEVSIASRTKHVITAVAKAESVPSIRQRLEDLTAHLTEYPEAKNLAVKEGAIRTLLHVRHQTEDEATREELREAFALLGHIEPLPNRGIRILSIDGGGIRGVLAIEIMKRLEETTGKKIYELFDYICGVSTGAILAALIGPHKKSLDEVSVLYKELSTKIFTQNTFWGTSNLVWSHAYYDTEMWEKLLKTYLGEGLMIKSSRDPRCPKISAISTVVNKSRVMAFLFRSYVMPVRVQSQYMGSHQHKIWEAIRASAAAPLYFEEFRLGDLLLQDGGILVNNPTAVAIHEARQLWPTSKIQCVVSLGTGRFNPVCNYPEEANTTSSSWKTKFMKILDSATDTEAVHTMLNDLLPGTVYRRFNPYITEMVPMDEISPDKMTQLETDAAMYFRRNEDKFHETARSLLEKRSLLQHTQDWIKLQRELIGYN